MGKKKMLQSYISDTGHIDFELQEYWENVNFNEGHT